MLVLMTEKELIEILKVSHGFLFKCRGEGMPYIALGRRMVRYDLVEVLKWLKSQNRSISAVQRCESVAARMNNNPPSVACIKDLYKVTSFAEY